MIRLLVLFAMTFANAAAAKEVRWRGDFLHRLEALALVQTLNADLLASRSATATLERWCGAHHLAAQAKVTAQRVPGPEKSASAETRARLAVSAEEPLAFRHVRLMCGDHVLSEADNWYVPARLTAEMNRLLAETDTPFGKAVAPLAPWRRTIAARLLWSPLPEGWEAMEPPPAGADVVLPAGLLEHRALLYDADGHPFSEVDEVYGPELLDFPAP